jgi:hypothetical protein
MGGQHRMHRSSEKKIEDYATFDEGEGPGVWAWKDWVFQTYSPAYIHNLQDEFRERKIYVQVGINAICDLYRRVQNLENK